MKRKFLGIVGVVCLLLLMQISQAMADYDSGNGMYTYSYNSSGTWKTARYKINYASTSTRYNPLNWVGYMNDSCPFGISGILGTNCFGFVSFVLNKEGRGKIISYTNNRREYNNQTGGELIDGCQWLNENHNGNGPDTNDVKSMFQKASVGDVVQMYWLGSPYSTPHTALISGFTDNGVYFFEANCFAEDRTSSSIPSAPPYSSYDDNKVRIPNINNHYYSYSTLAENYQKAGTYGGFSIYRFGEGGGDKPSPTPSGIPIDFPDVNFRNCVHEAFDTNGDWYLSESEIANAKVMNFNGKNIGDLEGIKFFTSLEELYVQGNKDAMKYAVDLSGLKKLRIIFCWNNQIPSLNLKDCESLTELRAYDNKLTSINVDGCTSLKKMFLWNNSFTAFGQGDTYAQSLEYLNVSGCTSMTGLNLGYYRNLKELHINGCSSLEWVSASESPITNTVDTSGCDSLKTFDRASGVKVTGTAPTITTSSLPDAYVGQSYSATIKASGTGSNNGRIFFWIDKGEARSNGFGSMRNYTGILTGAPKQESSALDITVRASNYVGETSKTFTIKVINGDKPKITTLSISEEAEVGEWFSEEIEAESPEAVTWSISNGELPPGLSLNSSTGEIRGRPESVEETRNGSGQKAYFFMVRATNTAGYDEEAYHLTITEPFKIVTTSLPNARKGVAYTAEIYAEGGYIHASAIDWMTWHADDLPEGLKLTSCHTYDSENDRYVRKAIISGTPTSSGTFRLYVYVHDVVGFLLDDRNFTIKVNAIPKITTSSLPDGYVGQAYSETLSATGTTPITWSANGLPSGLSCSSEGRITGTPNTSGSFTARITATNSLESVTQTLPLTIYTMPEISSTFQNGTVGTSYSDYVIVSGGALPYTWTKTNGTLPPGLSISPLGQYLTLEGTPSAAGTYTFSLQVKDDNGKTAVKSFTLEVADPTMTFTIPSSSTLKTPITWIPQVSGLTSPCTWTISSGKLPDGLSIDSSIGTISGTLTKAGTFAFTVKVTDKNNSTLTESFTVKVTKPAISGKLANSTLKAAYSKTLTVSGGTADYKWTKSAGTLPKGLKLTYSGNEATISGTPSKAGTFEFTLKVTDSNKATAKKSFTIKVTKPTISGTLPNGKLKTKYTGTLKVGSGTAKYTWVKSSGTLPKGLKLTSSNTKATISGKPTKAGTFTFKIKVTDANGATATKTFTVTISAASASDKESMNETGSESEKTIEKKQSEHDETQTSLPENSPEALEGEDTDVSLYTELNVVSDDIVEAYDGKDSDLVKVKAGEPLRFEIGDWGTEVEDVIVYVDDKPENSVEVSGEGEFTLPAEQVHDDFKVGVKAKSVSGKSLESQELFIIAE